MIKNLIVNADDFGLSKDISDAINTHITIQPHHNDIKHYHNKINILPIKEDVLDFLSCGLSLYPIFYSYNYICYFRFYNFNDLWFSC